MVKYKVDSRFHRPPRSTRDPHAINIAIARAFGPTINLGTLGHSALVFARNYYGLSLQRISHTSANEMATKKVIFVLFACFLGAASACVYNSDCGYLESCCSDLICRVNCYNCLTSYDCGSGECCSSDGQCYDCYYLTTGGIVGVVIGSLVLVAIVVSIVACCCCACCPYYRYRHPGTVVVQGTTPYQPFVSTTTTQQTVHQPPPMGYNPAQPPPYYPQPGPYPPPQAQGPYPPAQATTGQPIKQ